VVGGKSLLIFLFFFFFFSISPSNQQHIFGVLSIIRPVFRGLTRSLPESDLLKIEEQFERYMFDYDCLFNVMPIPACLWRRTGEIYKANKQFASLLNIPLDQLREGMLCIYEFMTEESLVHYYNVRIYREESRADILIYFYIEIWCDCK
jgi:PAS domain-containing protein